MEVGVRVEVKAVMEVVGKGDKDEGSDDGNRKDTDEGSSGDSDE